MYRSAWRSSRLLIVAWHGISIDDEHTWSPGFYMSAAQFTRRLQIIKDSGCNVLPLADALVRLRTHTLPERSVCLTFDDGFADFGTRALPILNSFGFPATLYFTTEYLGSGLPLFPSSIAYLAWSKRGFNFGKWQAGQLSTLLDLRTADSRARVIAHIISFANRRGLSLSERDQIITSFAERIGADHNRIRRDRILHLMTAKELNKAAQSGVDVQLHSHSHSVPEDRERFLEDLYLNRNKIEAATGIRPTGFCYPSGIYFPDYVEWLRDAGIRSAVTFAPGLASQADDSLLLPRYSDGCGRSDMEFEAWLSGLSNFIPGIRTLDRRFSIRPASVVSGEERKKAGSGVV